MTLHGHRRTRTARLASPIAVLLLALSATGALPAHATGAFTASITTLDSVLPSASDTISMDVAVANSTDAPITGIRARILISTSPLRGRSEIPDVVAGRTLPTYRLLDGDVASDIDLPSGASATITVRTTPEQLGLANRAPGVYLFGLFIDGDGAHSTRAVTLLPWSPTVTGKALGISTVWTLTAPPSRGSDGTFLDDALATEVQAGGRLRSQLDAMRTVVGATWLVDPLLIESLQALAGGARIRQSDGGVRAATDVEMQAASAWLADLSVAVTTGTLAAMPLGDLDVRGCMKFGRTTLVRHALSGAAQRLATAMSVPVVPLVVPIYGGAITDSVWRLLGELGARAVLVSDQGYGATQSAYTPTTGLEQPAYAGKALVFDQITSATPVASGLTAVNARQSFAAQLLMTQLERPNDTRAVTLLVPPSWNPGSLAQSTAVLDAAWLQHVSLSQALQAGTADRVTQQSSASPSQRTQNALTAVAVAEQRRLRVLTSDATFSALVDDLVGGVMSRWWTARGDGAAYAADTNGALTGLAESVRVVTRGDIVFGGEKGDVPVTVANGLPVPVDILLQATGIPSARVQAREYTSIHLNAGKRVSVELPTQVTGSGDAYLMLQVVAADYTEVGTASLLTVRSAAYARVASYLVAVAFAALILLIAANTVRRMRMRKLGLVEDE